MSQPNLPKATRVEIGNRGYVAMSFGVELTSEQIRKLEAAARGRFGKTIAAYAAYGVRTPADIILTPPEGVMAGDVQAWAVGYVGVEDAAQPAQLPA